MGSLYQMNTSRILIDTQILIWIYGDPSKVSKHLDVDTIERFDLFVSYASLWEMQIKQSIGKLVTNVPIWADVMQDGFRFLPIRLPHIDMVGQLPHHHRDPFDRMIIAQSLVEGVPILTADRAFDLYDVARV